MKKLVALVSMVAILFSCSIPVWAANGIFPRVVYPSDETGDGVRVKMQNVTYKSSINPNIQCEITTKDTAFAMIMNANSDKNGGTKSLRIYGKGTNIGGSTGSAKVSIHIGTRTPDNNYVVSFDAHRVYTNWQDYVALNESGWDSVARLEDSNSQWKVTPLGKGYDAGNYPAVGEWNRYEATLSTTSSPRLDFSVYEYGVMYVDNIVVKDTKGTIIFTEDFEKREEDAGSPGETGTYSILPKEVYPSDDTSDAEHYKIKNATYESSTYSKIKYVVNTEIENASYAMIMNANSDKNGGTKSLRIYGKGKNIEGTNTAAMVSMFLGEKTADNKYVVSFDAHRVYTNEQDYVALNEIGYDSVARLDDPVCQWKVTPIGEGYDAGYGVGNWNRYEATLTTMQYPQLNFSVSEWGVMYIDNIIVKDTSGNIIFCETFEDPVEIEESELPETPTYISGDINNDENVDVRDIMFLRRYVAGGYGVVLDESIADINQDSNVDVKDIMLLRRYVAGGYGIVLPPVGNETKRNFILGTDWWTDCDDAVALRILARAHKAGDISVKGIGINGCMEYSVQSLGGFLNSEGVSDIPIGIDLNGTDFGGDPPYQKRLAQLPSKYNSNADAENAVKLYRRILAESEGPIEIIEVGYLQVIANVLESGPDEISDKTGLELVKEKVSKIWVMAGKWDENPGKENNFTRNDRSRQAGSIFCKKCPVPVTFLGYEVGSSVITGGELEKDDILYKVLYDHGSQNGRMSWDPMLVQMAIIGDEAKAGYDVVQGTASVNSYTGENTFQISADGKHKYVVKKMSSDYYRKQINDLIK